jgi:hypothetical protein
MRRIDKKGQQMTLGTIIAIILGVIVVVFLIYGFSTGWSNLWSKLTGSVAASNVEDKLRDCETDCSLGETSAYCFENKDLRFFGTDGNLIKVTGTCVQFDSSDFTGDGKVTAGQIKGLGSWGCATISCPAAENGGETKTCEQLGGRWVVETTCPADNPEITPTDLSTQGTNNKCCTA